MKYSADKMEEFVALLERHSPQEGLNETSIPDLVTFRQTDPHQRCPAVYEPALVILGQGKKHCYVDGRKYDYSAGYYLTLFLPMPIEVEVVEASADKPLLMAGIKIDLIKIANILLKMDRAGQRPAQSGSAGSSVIFAEPLNDELLEPIIKLLRTLDSPLERAVLGDSILEEIYFRLICNDHSGSLERLLQHRGQVQQISKVVDHIHQHLDQVVSVDELAGIVNMSTSGFRKTFREVMHMPPLQYAKSIKLNRAQALIREGKNVSEAGYLVGYNSPAQFSREYKRHFGYSPSAT
jgi:AraC-like DNA-binding protein